MVLAQASRKAASLSAGTPGGVEKARKNNIPVKTLEELEQSVEELFVATPYSYSLSLSLSLAHSLSLTLAHSLTLSLTLFHTHTHTSSKP